MGHPTNYINLNMRCKGEINSWASKAFYGGRMIVPTEPDSSELRHARKFVQHYIGTKISTNRAFISVKSQHSKAHGSQSLINPGYAAVVISTIEQMMLAPFHVGSITIITMYKAQHALYEKLLSTLDTSSRSRVRVMTVEEREAVAGNRNLKLPAHIVERLHNGKQEFEMHPMTIQACTTGTAIGHENDTVFLDLTRSYSSEFIETPRDSVLQPPGLE